MSMFQSKLPHIQSKINIYVVLVSQKVLLRIDHQLGFPLMHSVDCGWCRSTSPREVEVL